MKMSGIGMNDINKFRIFLQKSLRRISPIFKEWSSRIKTSDSTNFLISRIFTNVSCQVSSQTMPYARCLKITEKVSFNIASEASYVYILSGQKLIKNARNGSFWRFFENLKLAVKQCYQTDQF